MAPITSTAIADRLRERLGDAALSGSAPSRTDAYVTVAPDDAAGVAAALQLCSEERWPVRIQGAGTWLVGMGAEPAVVISTARLDRVIEYEPADLVIGVEAGVTLERLNAQLALNRQWLPLDPPAQPGVTIGAVAALGASGPLRARYGTPRDMVVGLEVATASGRLVHFGGRVVKNVAGYDGVRLLVGSRGTLGVITSLYLRVRGTPQADRTLAIGCNEAGFAVDAALRLRDAVECDALELLSPALAEAVGAGSSWTVLVRVTGGEAAVEESVARVRGISQARERTADVWSRLNDLEAAARSCYRLSGPVTDLKAGVDAAVRLAKPQSDSVLCAAHAADGVVRIWPAKASVVGPMPAERESMPPGWTLMRVPVVAQAEGGPVAELTSRIRSVFDPAGILVAK